MLFRRRRGERLEQRRAHELQGPDEAAELLWRELEGWFKEEDGMSHDGPELTFSKLEPADVERVWRFLAERAPPLDPRETSWDEAQNAQVSVIEALERGAVAAATRCPNVIVPLDGIVSHGVRLPWLGVFLYPDSVGFYWWVSDAEGWGPDTVAALARLIGDLGTLAPRAQLDLEWGGLEEFLPPVDAYVSACALAGERPSLASSDK